MNRKNPLLKRLAVAMLCLTAFAGSIYADVNPKPFVVPELTTWTGAEGRFVPAGRVVVSKGDAVARKIAESFVADYEALTGVKMSVVTGKGQKGDFVLSIKKNKALGSEGYTMNISETAQVSAATAQGLFWATRTLLQLSEQSAERAIPCGSSVDKPRYAMRGFMIDCGRKYIPMSYLCNLVKMMAYYKMNTLQVHLNDNGFPRYFANDWDKTQAAFRLECDTYPGLTAKDGSYTKQEFIDFQKLAENNGVEIIPEIDVPAHSLAFTHYKPEIGSKEYGMDHLDIFKPETYEFLDGLFKEYIGGKNPVFRGPRVHIGTDEYSNRKKEVVEKFREFTDRYIKYVEKFGKQAVVWGSLTHADGETPVKAGNVLMSCWNNGFAKPEDMKKQGYKLISIPDGLVYIVPAAGYYYDYLNCHYLYNNWTPAVIGGVKFEEGDPAVVGGMFAVWNDHVGNGISTKDIHDRIFPALQTLSVKCWTGADTKLPFEEFDKQRHQLSEAPAVNEAGRLKAPVTLAEVKPNAKLPVSEVGYDYTVTFTVKGAAEAKGTELFRSDNAVFYLSDPRSGKLGFARDGYLNTFNYRIPEGKEVTLTIQGNNKMTRLLENGKLKEELGPQTLYAKSSLRLSDYQYDENLQWPTDMYHLGEKIHYQRTLVFPLAQTGNFKSTVTNLKVSQGIE